MTIEQEHLKTGLWSMRVARAEREARQNVARSGPALERHIRGLDTDGVLELVENTRVVVCHVRNGLSIHTRTPYDTRAGAEAGAGPPLSYDAFLRTAHSQPERLSLDFEASEFPAFLARNKPPQAEAAHEAMYNTLSDMTAKQFALNRLGERIADQIGETGGRAIPAGEMQELVQSVLLADRLHAMAQQPEFTQTMQRVKLDGLLERAAGGMPTLPQQPTGAATPPATARRPNESTTPRPGL